MNIIELDSFYNMDYESYKGKIITNNFQILIIFGLPYFKILSETLQLNKIDFILNCGDSSEYAMQAIYSKFPKIFFEGDEIYKEKLSQIAEQLGIKILSIKNFEKEQK